MKFFHNQYDYLEIIIQNRIMKKITLTFILFFIYQLTPSQCTVNATSFNNNTVASYDVNGDITVTLNSNNTISLDLGSNFMTADGPDIRAYLVNSNGIPDEDLKMTPIGDLDFIEFGLVGCDGCNPQIPANGAKSFNVAIPNGEDIRDYDKVFFYCLQFDAFWDFGSIVPFSNSNCNILSVDENDFNSSFKIYPNPTYNDITIENDKHLNISISIFNVLGKEILNTKNSKSSNIKLNLSSLKAGVYLLRTTSNGLSHTTRLIKQ